MRTNPIALLIIVLVANLNWTTTPTNAQEKTTTASASVATTEQELRADFVAVVSHFADGDVKCMARQSVQRSQVP